MSTTNNSLSILSKSGSWIRGNPGRFACMLIVAVLYGLLLACIVQPDYEGFMAAALMINFLVPPVLLIINIAAACFRKSTWKFPLGCVAVSLPLLFALIHGFEGGPCAKADVCTSIGGWQLSWGCMEQIGYFMLVFTVFSFVGFALVRLIALPAGASVAHQVVALPPVGDGYAGAAVRMRLCGCSHDGEVAATPGRKTRF